MDRDEVEVHKLAKKERGQYPATLTEQIWSIKDWLLGKFCLRDTADGPERARWLHPYGLLTKCEVKMAGYWPSSFFACLWTETKSRSINSQKKNEANIQPP